MFRLFVKDPQALKLEADLDPWDAVHKFRTYDLMLEYLKERKPLEFYVKEEAENETIDKIARVHVHTRESRDE